MVALEIKNAFTGATKRTSAKASQQSVFSADEYEQFDAKLKEETQLAIHWGVAQRYQKMAPSMLGCEIESCLIDSKGMPLPESAAFLEYFSGSNGYHEMAKFNAEFEIDPVRIEANVFSQLYDSLENNRVHTSRCADFISGRVIMAGILPTLAAEHLGEDMITDRLHFRTLAAQLSKMNKGRPFRVNIGYGDGIVFDAHNLSIEGAATSLQVHLAVSEQESAAFYNAAQVASAVMVGVAANSPFFMGRQLWAETRVPLFEQIMYERFVSDAPDDAPRFGRHCDRIFGDGYLRETMLELIADNHVRMRAVLPIVRDHRTEEMKHLILHNRDILRWNRPVLGFHNGKPFLRIEHRVMPSGPTVIDMVANMALFVGLVYFLKNVFKSKADDTAKHLPFESVRANFYQAARDGMEADIVWLGGRRMKLKQLVLNEIIKYARRGLRSCGVTEIECKRWLDDIIAARVLTGQSGSVWQRHYVAGCDDRNTAMQKMTETYWYLQEEGAPVHTWQV